MKFDDAVMDLGLDVKLSDDKPWQKIRPENMRATRRAPRLDEAGNQEELDPLALELVLRSQVKLGPGTGANAAPLGISSQRNGDSTMDQT